MLFRKIVNLVSYIIQIAIIQNKGVFMSVTFEVIERVGTSNESSSDAIKSVVLEANKANKVGWFEVIEERGRVTQDGNIEFQVKVKIGYKLD